MYCIVKPNIVLITPRKGLQKVSWLPCQNVESNRSTQDIERKEIKMIEVSFSIETGVALSLALHK